MEEKEVKFNEETKEITFKIYNDPHGDPLYDLSEESITFKPGLTCLVGCNGYGKTTLLNRIREIHHNDDEDFELVEQKPAWSEKDNEHVNSLLKRLDGLCRKEFTTTRFAINEDENWLKSLKERYTWKPSDEQMNTLEYYMHTLVCNEHKEVLFGLYADLKKLREE